MKEKRTACGSGEAPRIAGIPISEVMGIFAQAGAEAYARLNLAATMASRSSSRSFASQYPNGTRNS